VNAFRHDLRASFAFVERNFFLSRRYWGWEVAFLVYSVAGALSVSLIGADQGDRRLLLFLMIGAILWNYLSVVFSWIAETIAVERWEGTLEYTMMAPIRRWAHLVGSCLYAIGYGLVHTAVVLVVLVAFFGLDLSRADVASAAAILALGSVSFIGIGMIAAILPLLYVERGDQMIFVLQSSLLLVSGVYYSIEVLPGWMQVLAQGVEGAGKIDQDAIRDWLRNNEVKTVGGNWKFDERGLPPPYSYLTQVIDGKVELVWPKAVQSHEPIAPKPAWGQ